MARSNVAFGVLVIISLLFLSHTSPLPAIWFHSPHSIEAGGITNIRVQYLQPIKGELALHHGPCDGVRPTELIGRTTVGDYPSARRHAEWEQQRPTRVVWVVPEGVQENCCFHAYVDGESVGVSAAVTVETRKVRRTIPIGDIADAEGPWFDGVAALRAKEPDSRFVAKVIKKSIGILGGEMAGLMTALLLDTVGIHDWKILEASDRIGGRVHTYYLNGTNSGQYQYQEMGAMRFPVNITYPNGQTLEIQDHKMVFQLAAVMNQRNGNNESLAVNFIPFIEASRNMPADTPILLPDGQVPSVSQAAENSSLMINMNSTYSNATAVAAANSSLMDWVGLATDPEKVKLFATNIFEAHKQAVENGMFDISESGYMRYRLGIDLNVTDETVSVSNMDPTWLYDAIYFSASTWVTVDQGLDRLPQSFMPLVANRTAFGAKVWGMSWNESAQRLTVEWRPSRNPAAVSATKEEFDYVVNSVPFSIVRVWQLPEYSSLLSRAIRTLNYAQSCKVALMYQSRFWEHLENPTIGGCASVAYPGIETICYPSYNINGSGPGVLLAQYNNNSPTYARSLGSMTEEEHIAFVKRAMVEIHGSAAHEQYTGTYKRICWENDPNSAGAWAAPYFNQQQLYLPAYFQTEKKTVFIGEHTSYTHAWIFSALESAVRGTTQLLLDMGLVDEAQNITNMWMARWISL